VCSHSDAHVVVWGVSEFGNTFLLLLKKKAFISISSTLRRPLQISEGQNYVLND